MVWALSLLQQTNYFIPWLVGSQFHIQQRSATLLCYMLNLWYILKLNSFFYIFFFIHERHREKQRHRQREKQAPRREPDAGLDPGPQDHALSRRQLLNHWATQVPQFAFLQSGGASFPMLKCNLSMFLAIPVHIFYPRFLFVNSS